MKNLELLRQSVFPCAPVAVKVPRNFNSGEVQEPRVLAELTPALMQTAELVEIADAQPSGPSGTAASGPGVSAFNMPPTPPNSDDDRDDNEEMETSSADEHADDESIEIIAEFVRDPRRRRHQTAAM